MLFLLIVWYANNMFVYFVQIIGIVSILIEIEHTLNGTDRCIYKYLLRSQ